MKVGLLSASRSPSSRLMTTNGPSGCLLGMYVRNTPARKAPNKTDVPVKPAMAINAERTRVMRIMFEIWSNCAKRCSMNLRKKGANTHLVTMGMTTAMPIDATMGRPMSQPRLTSSPESLPKSPITLYSCQLGESITQLTPISNK